MVVAEEGSAKSADEIEHHDLTIRSMIVEIVSLSPMIANIQRERAEQTCQVRFERAGEGFSKDFARGVYRG